MAAPADVRFVEANGLRFGYLESGSGPLVLLVHGFPDTPYSWDATRAAVAGAGFRAVAPFTRGYAPTAVPDEERYDTDTLGRDVLGLIRGLGEQSAVVVGHDWGASAAYAAASLEPSAVRLLATVAIPHPASIAPTPRAIWGVRHFFALGRAGAARWVPDRDFAYIDELLRRWSPAWSPGPEESAAVKKIFSDPRSLDAALGYYRALTLRPPPTFRVKISVPTVCFAGDSDILPVSAYDRAAKCFSGRYQVIPMPGGHFMHREHPEVFNAHLLSVLQRVPR